MHEKTSCKGTRKKYFRTKKLQAVACYRILTVQEIIARIKNEIKSFYMDRETVTRMRRQVREWEKVFANSPSSDRHAHDSSWKESHLTRLELERLCRG